MTRFLLTLLILFASAVGENQPVCGPPAWTVDLAREYGFRAFGMERSGDSPHPQGWIESRGVTFLSPDLIAVYQVLPSGKSPSLGSRDTVGAESFVLQIQVLATKDGRPVKSLHLVTGSHTNRFSPKWESATLFPSVLPTHNGRFLVRTKGMLRVFSADFEEIASKELPSNRESTSEGWKFSMSPRGDTIYAEHTEDFFSRNEPGLGRFKLTRYLMDADTLRILRSWGDKERPWGSPWEPKYKAEGAEGGKGANKIVITPDSTHPSMTVALNGRDRAVSELLTDALLAVEIHHYRADRFDLGRCSKPIRLAIYDLASKLEKCFIPITEKAGPCGSGFLFSASSISEFGVVEGTELSLYHRVPSGEDSPAFNPQIEHR